MQLLVAVALFFSTLTNADVVKLVQAGLSPETIEAKIASSPTSFDTSTEALVALADAGVPDRVVRAMIVNAPAVAPASPPTTKSAAVSRRYDVAVHTPANTRCEGAELRIDGKGISATRCRRLDFNIAWASARGVCYEYGFRGVVTVTTATGEHRFSTVTPAEAKRIVEHVRQNAPTVAVGACAR